MSFVDYVGFYYPENSRELTKNRFSDNDNTQKFWPYLLDYSNSRWCIAYVVYYDLIVPVCRFETITVLSEKKTKVSVYWKWLKVFRESPELYEEFVALLFHMWYKEKYSFSYCRLDVTSDYSRLNFTIKCLLKTRKNSKWFAIRNMENGSFETKYFWSKKSSVYIRYYNKKLELSEKWWQDLYPEYEQYNQVMRYEIQLKSKSIPKNVQENYNTLSGLSDLILWHDTNQMHIAFPSRKSKHSLIRAKSLFSSFLTSLSTRYDLSDSLDDINILYNQRLKQYAWK